MDIRQRVYDIPELVLNNDIFTMATDIWNDYVRLLNEFVNSYPSIEKRLKSVMASKDSIQILRSLNEIAEILRGINANILADECKRRINSFNRSNPERLEAYVEFLLSSMTTLSIDIQMALSPSRPIVTAESEKQVDDDGDTDEKPIVIAVDDDTYCLQLVKSALAKLPCKVIPVTSGKAALDMLNKVKPHLFILDIEMPDMTGIDLAKALKSHGRRAPIMFLTGNATREYVQKCLELGAVDFIVKPINPDNVANRVGKFLN